INLEIEQGDVVGIIGKNGAGKSTLLKLLSRVTKPTTGSIKYNGRIASLLEVGTGFHPEMTGRENIYMNGAIMGMTRAEITHKLEEIINFAGVERYIDTPVKRYSSGMTVRLGFSIAAHLEPDILVVDEVLAVGDAEFQKKAIGKMQDVSKGGGRTVLFVSHNMAAVKSLCGKGIVLENGMVIKNGTTEAAISYYLSGENSLQNRKVFNNDFSNSIFNLKAIQINNVDNDCTEPIVENKEIEITTEIEIFAHAAERYSITYHLVSEMGEPLFSFYDKEKNSVLQKGINILSCTFAKDFFQSGNYFLNLFIVKDRKASIANYQSIMSFTVADGGRDLGIYMGREPGYIRPQTAWTLK
ncbi:MAG: ABC transporter ATP-binding protein, partial [Clostridia bacterium]|nr:ABC transporter ATP-binding protein [Clostridia bacterium]